MVNILDKELCCGCGACCNVCPSGAITMKYNQEGFLYPSIDKAKCINCGLCIKKCPLSKESFLVNSFWPKCYAVQSSESTIQHSSSGGVFSVLANYVLEKGGYVCGAAFDKTWNVKHKIISNKSDLYELQTSKYVQSDTKKVYTKIRELLNNDKTVLFSGTPCQVAGLYSFLGCDNDKLITVEVFCHGVPSPKVWTRYLKEINVSEISDINFRYKAPPYEWYKCAFCIKNKHGEFSVLDAHTENIYMRGFLQDLYLRKSCYHCPFAKMPRGADFSIGDFWGNKVKKHDKKGLSAVLLNTIKSNTIFSDLKKSLFFCKEVKLDDVIGGNPCLTKSKIEHKNRMSFFNDLKKEGSVVQMIQKNLKSKDVGILNFSSFAENNFGACLVGFAMEKNIEKLGYIPHTINFIQNDSLFNCTTNTSSSNFRNRFLHLTGIVQNKNDLIEHINPIYDKFIIGSDQIVRHPWHRDFVYYLDWVFGNKSLLSYAASFGLSNLGMNKKEQKYAKRCLDRFDAFSVRAESDSDIMQNYFGKYNIPVVCDPTLLLNAEDYQEIVDYENCKNIEGDYVAYYFLDQDESCLIQIQKKYQTVNAYKDNEGNDRSFGQWLNIIKNAKYVITDSFHGSVFSVIYRKQFIVLTTEMRGNERLESLMKIIGCNRLISDRGLLTEQYLCTNRIDYNRCENSIKKAQQHGYECLRSMLEKEPSYKTPMYKKHRKHHSFWWHLLHMKF